MPSSNPGSSRLLLTKIYRVVGYTGPQGVTGPIGNTGNTGNDGYGETGATGPSLIDLQYVNQRIVNVYDTGESFQTADNIVGPTGYYMVGISGDALGSEPNIFRLSGEFLYRDPQTTDDAEYRKIVYVRNISTTTPNEIQFEYGSGGEIQVDYNLIDISSLEVDGTPNKLVVNLPGNLQSGIDGTTYDTSNGSVFAVMANIGSKLRVKNGTTDTNPITYQYWTCDINTEGNVFYLSPSPSNLSFVSFNKLILVTPQNPSYAHSITVVFPPNSKSGLPMFFEYSASSSTQPRNTEDLSPVVWPLGDVPCLSGNYDVFNFISIGGVWYGYVAAYNRTAATIDDTTGVTFDNVDDASVIYGCHSQSGTSARSTSLLLNQSACGYTFGVCCNSTCGFTLTDTYGCTGYFFPGITNGVTFCSSEGACCLFTKEGSPLKCEELTYCECSTIASASNFNFSWTAFTGIKTSCKDFDCTLSYGKIGACCDGTGICVETTKDQCSGHWQGAGIKCVNKDNLNVCYSGYGACCDSGVTCENGITGSTCFEQNKTYFGDQSTCGCIDCSAESIPCYGVVPNQTLKIGDVFENGIVVGIFNPNGAECFGNGAFGANTSTQDLNKKVTNQVPVKYRSIYDYSGYGHNLSSTCENNSDSYIMLMSLHPVTLDDNQEIVTYTGNSEYQTTFIWNNGSNGWGPIINSVNYSVNTTSYNTKQEGYIFNRSVNETRNNISYLSFPMCGMIRKTDSPDDWLINNPNTSFNGKWYRNYGFMNTLRLLNSEYFYFKGVSASGIEASDYTPVEDEKEITIARAVSLYNIKYPATNNMVSDWFVPSHDELAFIANSCVNLDANENINLKLMLANGTPLYDWYWSSTGSFGTEDGSILNGTKNLTPGSVAWAIKFDSDGNESNFVVKKRNRITEKCNLRLIRMIRCDAQYNNKYWRLLRLNEKDIQNNP